MKIVVLSLSLDCSCSHCEGHVLVMVEQLCQGENDKRVCMFSKA